MYLKFVIEPKYTYIANRHSTNEEQIRYFSQIRKFAWAELRNICAYITLWKLLRIQDYFVPHRKHSPTTLQKPTD